MHSLLIFPPPILPDEAPHYVDGTDVTMKDPSIYLEPVMNCVSRGQRTAVGRQKGTRTARNIDEHLSDILHACQRFEGIQPFLDETPERPALVYEFFMNLALPSRRATDSRVESAEKTSSA